MGLNDEIYERITDLSSEGDEFADAGNFGKAIERYSEALKLIPEPQYDWEASTWLYVAIGDAYYLDENFEKALHNMEESLKCPDGLDNPFIQLRLGECFFELGNITKAKEHLLKAYMIEGEEIFEDEPQKYMNLISEII